MQHRYYDPATGRFVSEDPTKSGVNYFTYCSGDPVGRVDNDGLADTPDYQQWMKGLGQFFALLKFVGLVGGGGYWAIMFTTAAMHNAAKNNYAMALVNCTAASLCFAIALYGTGANVSAIISIALSAGQGGYLACLQSEAENAELGTKSGGFAYAAIAACVAEGGMLIGGCVSADYAFLDGS